MHQDILLFVQSLNRAEIPASECVTPNHTHPLRCSYIMNVDGTIRWVWPASGRKADFLRFYHVCGWKPRAFALLASIAAFLGVLRWLSKGRFTIFLPEVVSAEIKHAWGGRWAWFSGTVGPNQKALLWKKQQGKSCDVFVKIPLTENAIRNLGIEYDRLKHLYQPGDRHIVLPEPVKVGAHCLQTGDIGRHAKRVNRIAALPAAALQQWLSPPTTLNNSGNALCENNINTRIQRICMGPADHRIPRHLVERVSQLYAAMKHSVPDFTSTAHGDFTPWNVMKKGNSICLIDLELSHPEMPPLFDLFHYVYQSNILIGNKGYKAIRRELDALFRKPFWKKWLDQQNIDVVSAEKWYLLYNVSYYLEIYSAQPTWHMQVEWLLRTWNEALAWQLRFSNAPRKLLLSDFGQLLQGKRYALLKWQHEDITALPETSDLDLCIPKQAALEIIRGLKQHPLVVKAKIIRRSNMFQLELLLVDGSLLHIDMIHNFCRKSLWYLDIEGVLDRASENENGLRIPSGADDFLYTVLFYWLNKADVPERYRSQFVACPSAARERVLKTLTENFGISVEGLENFLQSRTAYTGAIVREIRRKKENTPVLMLIRLAAYAADVVKGFFPEPGFVVTFSGVDGAGKSTVIDCVRFEVEKRFRKKVVVLRHRPSILPILSAWTKGKKEAEAAAAATLPRQGTNKSPLSSALRFAYYFSDYLIGQWIIQFRYVLRGYVVLYDRYYFDFINDPERSNIRIPAVVTRSCYHLLIKPRLNIFLYADAEVIRRRKKELDAPAIVQLTQSYLRLFLELNKRSGYPVYLALENNRIEETLSSIVHHITSVVYEKAA